METELSKNLRLSNYSDFMKGEVLGQGAFGRVYKCSSKSGAVFAMKAIEVVKPEYRDVVEREVLILVGLDQHEHLVQFYGSVVIDKVLNIFIEYVPNGNLKKYIEVNKSLKEKETSDILKGILSGVEFLHKSKVLHRDIKPENILLGNNNTVKLTDFGLSKNLDNLSAFKSHTFCGTCKYMAPELLDDKEYNYGVDIWSIGITVIEMIDGKPICPEFNDFKFISEMARGREINFKPKTKISQSLNYFLDLCLVKNPNFRAKITDLIHCGFVKQQLHPGN